LFNVISACTDVVAQAGLTDNTTSNEKNGELLKPMCNLNVKPIATAVDDSGTESGEEVNQKILVQVQGALANLESALPALDPLRRSSVVELLTKLQTSLKLSSTDQTGKPTPPPRKCWNRKTAVGRQDRHTVGVSSEELQDARRWLEENGYGENNKTAAPSAPAAAESARNTPRSYEVAAPKTFRPVKFVPPPPKRTNHLAEDCVIPEPSRHALQNCNSFSFPPAQQVIVEDLDCKRRKTSTATTISLRDSSESSAGGSSSPSSSSGDDDDDGGRSVSSAQRLLQIASNDHCRKFRLQGKRVKLKRGAAGERGRSSGDDDEYRPRRVPQIKEPPPVATSGGGGSGVPLFEPKTANDKKYLALLRQQADADEKAATASAYNPLQGKLQGNWGNRFGRIKTTFERKIGSGGGGGVMTTSSAAVSPNRNVAKTFWHDICKCPSDDSIAYYRSKKFTSFKPDTSPAAVATGKWSGENRGFSHGARSAFKPVQQQQLKQQQLQQFVPLKPVPKSETSLLEPPRTVPYPKHLPLYNSSVTTAHRPFVYSDASDDPVSPPTPHYECAPQPATVVSRVMGSPQTATIVKSKQRSDRIGGGPSPSSYPSLPSSFPSPSSSYPSSSSLLKTIPAPVRQPFPSSSSVKAISANHNNNPLQSSNTAPKPPTRSPRVVTQQRSPTNSPVRMPSVLQKSESWHQMIVGQSRAAARSPLPHIPSAVPLRHASAPYEGYMHCKREIAQKQDIVRQHLHAGTESASSCRRASPKLVKLNDDIDKVDDTFESLFKEATRPSK